MPPRMSGRRGTKKLCVAITGHGFGHATRTAEVVRELHSLCAELEITISSTVPRRFIEQAIGGPILYRPQSYEPGTIQKNCFEVDIAGTRAAYLQHLEERPERIRAEVDFLRREAFSGLLADIPAIAIAAAHAAGIPAVGLWNFTWDWILEPILAATDGADSRVADVPKLIREDYSLADLHLRLPFSPPKSPYARVEPVPLVGRKSSASREATLGRIGLDPSDSRPIVLVAMSGWDCTSWSPIQIQGCEGFRWVVAGDVPLISRAPICRIPAIQGPGYTFFDLVRSADAVLSKPGYGIASECVVNRTPLLGVERRDFKESHELVRGLRDFGPFVEISLCDFHAGNWQPSLEALLGTPRAWKPIEENGARLVAERLRAFFDF